MKTSSFFVLHAAYGTVGSLNRFRTALTPVFGGVLLRIRAKQSVPQHWRAFLKDSSYSMCRSILQKALCAGCWFIGCEVGLLGPVLGGGKATKTRGSAA